MDRKKREHRDQNLSEDQPSTSGPLEITLEELAGKVAKKLGIDETETLKLLRCYEQYLASEVERKGQVTLGDLGILKRAGGGAPADLVLEPFLNSDTWRKHLLFGRDELVGKVTNIEYPPEGEPVYSLEFHFPVDALLERMAEHQGVSADELQQTFQRQLDEAGPGMIETGEGRMPDFGVLRYDELNAPWFTFEPREELVRFFEEES